MAWIRSLDPCSQMPAEQVAIELLCGGLGGQLAAACVHPLDVLKTRAQAGMAWNVRSIVKSEGLRGFYRGVTVPLVSQPLYIGTAFAGYELGNQLWDAHARPHLRSGSLNDVLRLFFAGALGGAVCATCVTPFERLKVRMQSQTGVPLGPLRTARDLCARGGLPALFAGLGATIAREVPGTIIWFAAYDIAMRRLREWHTPRPLAVVGGGLTAGLAFTMSTLPLERIKTIQQASAGGAGSALAIATRVLRHEGVAGFYLGLLPVLTRNLLMDVIQWSAADAIRQRAARQPT